MFLFQTKVEKEFVGKLKPEAELVAKIKSGVKYLKNGIQNNKLTGNFLNPIDERFKPMKQQVAELWNRAGELEAEVIKISTMGAEPSTKLKSELAELNKLVRDMGFMVDGNNYGYNAINVQVEKITSAFSKVEGVVSDMRASLEENRGKGMAVADNETGKSTNLYGASYIEPTQEYVAPEKDKVTRLAPEEEAEKKNQMPYGGIYSQPAESEKPKNLVEYESPAGKPEVKKEASVLGQTPKLYPVGVDEVWDDTKAAYQKNNKGVAGVPELTLASANNQFVKIIDYALEKEWISQEQKDALMAGTLPANFDKELALFKSMLRVSTQRGGMAYVKASFDAYQGNTVDQVLLALPTIAEEMTWKGKKITTKSALFWAREFDSILAKQGIDKGALSGEKAEEKGNDLAKNEFNKEVEAQVDKFLSDPTAIAARLVLGKEPEDLKQFFLEKDEEIPRSITNDRGETVYNVHYYDLKLASILGQAEGVLEPGIELSAQPAEDLVEAQKKVIAIVDCIKGVEGAGVDATLTLLGNTDKKGAVGRGRKNNVKNKQVTEILEDAMVENLKALGITKESLEEKKTNEKYTPPVDEINVLNWLILREGGALNESINSNFFGENGVVATVNRKLEEQTPKSSERAFNTVYEVIIKSWKDNDNEPVNKIKELVDGGKSALSVYLDLGEAAKIEIDGAAVYTKSSVNKALSEMIKTPETNQAPVDREGNIIPTKDIVFDDNIPQEIIAIGKDTWAEEYYLTPPYKYQKLVDVCNSLSDPDKAKLNSTLEKLFDSRDETYRTIRSVTDPTFDMNTEEGKINKAMVYLGTAYELATGKKIELTGE